MSYDFSFNKKTLSLLLAGCAFVGIMLFIAGMLIGASWKSEPAVATNTTAPAAVGQQPATPPTAPDRATAPQAAAPKETALKAEPVTQRPPDPSEVVIPGPAPTPVRQAHRNITFGSRRESAPPPIPEGDDVKIIQEAEQTAPPDASGAKSFSIQVGVFVKEGDANQLVRQLQSKGYAPFVLTSNDDGSKVLYAVRVGAYANFDEAARAASDFTRQEKIQTMVRPLGSL